VAEAVTVFVIRGGFKCQPQLSTPQQQRSGFVINSIVPVTNQAGQSVRRAMLNGDGFDDIIIWGSLC